MITKTLVKPGFYLDSVALMRLSATLKAGDGIDEAVMMIGTDANKQIMRDAGLLDESVATDAGPSDLLIGIRAESAEALDRGAAQAEATLMTRDATAPSAASTVRPVTLQTALAQTADANLALVSTPGTFAIREARAALLAGLNVMIFSDNVPVADEVALKQLAARRGLLVMGPDCGTAYIGGTPLAFANAVAAGEVGVVAASGTGLQEVAVLLSRAGAGISHGIGVGGRDLGDAVGGLSTFAALDLLEADDHTKRIVLISKPPGPATAAALFERLRHCPKPVHVCLLGFAEPVPGLDLAPTLEGVVEQALGHRLNDRASDLAPDAARRDQRGGFAIGLFSGGTLCAEAQVLFQTSGLAVRSNAPVHADAHLPAGAWPDGTLDAHLMLDLGADEFTQGRPHPMIEPAVRDASFAQALETPGAAVVLVDVVLGFGAHPDPAGALTAVLARHTGPRPAVVAYVCGTESDPQGFAQQVRALEDAGVIVAASNAQAARLAAKHCD